MLTHEFRNRKKIFAFVGFLVLLVVFPPFLTRYLQELLIQTLIWAILAMSLDIQLGYTGLPSLGHAAYMGISAYTTAILLVRYQGTFLEALALSLVIVAITAALFGLIALRTTSHYYLMMTFCFTMVIWGLAYRWVSLTDGDNGITGVVRPNIGLPWSLTETIYFYYFTFIFFAVSLTLMLLVIRSPFGKTLVGIRESESRMRCLGYNVWLHKYLAFIISAIFSGLSGVVWVLYNRSVSPPYVDLHPSMEALLMVALGGSGTLFGGIVGASIIILLKNLVSVYTYRWLMIMGGIYVLVVFFAPEGILGLVRQISIVGHERRLRFFLRIK